MRPDKVETKAVKNLKTIYPDVMSVSKVWNRLTKSFKWQMPGTTRANEETKIFLRYFTVSFFQGPEVLHIQQLFELHGSVSRLSVGFLEHFSS